MSDQLKKKLEINLRLELRGLNLRIPCLKAKEIFFEKQHYENNLTVERGKGHKRKSLSYWSFVSDHPASGISHQITTCEGIDAFVRY